MNGALKQSSICDVAFTGEQDVWDAVSNSVLDGKQSDKPSSK